ncbi:MAG: hypothetical protein PUG13_01175, partial [Streptococcus hyointestinalis]
ASLCFGTIRNSTALKPICKRDRTVTGFGTIRNSTALKLPTIHIKCFSSFGTIRNSTALKPRGPIFVPTFRNRAVHLS